MLKTIKQFAIGIAIPLLVGGLAALLTRESMDIYESIVKPILAPPGIVFPIAWSILYVLMGVGSVLVYRTEGQMQDKKTAFWIYGGQLFVNFFWSLLFFNKRAFGVSFIWLCILWGLIIAMTVAFRKVNKTAAWLQIPYLVWVTFAGYLNLMIWLLN